jgi:hypothetical protein
MRKPVFVLVFWVLFATVVPLVFYFDAFRYAPVSSVPGDWGNFGQYVDGTVGTLLSVVNIAVIIYMAIAVHRLETKREHDMVRPFAYINAGDYEDDVYVKIQNLGLGPMIIIKCRCYENNDKANAVDDLVDLMPELDGVNWSTFTLGGPPEVIPAGGESLLIEYETDDMDVNFIINREFIRDSLKNITIELEYSDMFGGNVTSEIKMLSIFGRN